MHGSDERPIEKGTHRLSRIIPGFFSTEDWTATFVQDEQMMA